MFSWCEWDINSHLEEINSDSTPAKAFTPIMTGKLSIIRSLLIILFSVNSNCPIKSSYFRVNVLSSCSQNKNEKRTLFSFDLFRQLRLINSSVQTKLALTYASAVCITIKQKKRSLIDVISLKNKPNLDCNENDKVAHVYRSYWHLDLLINCAFHSFN